VTRYAADDRRQPSTLRRRLAQVQLDLNAALIERRAALAAGDTDAWKAADGDVRRLTARSVRLRRQIRSTPTSPTSPACQETR
jgi:hypothetical protein